VVERCELGAHLLADGVLDEERVGGDAEDDVAGACVGVKEAYVLPQHGLQVPPPERADLALPRVHPARDLCTDTEQTHAHTQLEHYAAIAARMRAAGVSGLGRTPTKV
jgi:hypothetical protein